jgi:hypothetical protein
MSNLIVAFRKFAKEPEFLLRLSNFQENVTWQIDMGKENNLEL